MEAIEASLNDTYVRSGFRLSLTQRFFRLSKSVEKKKLFKLNRIDTEKIGDPIEVSELIFLGKATLLNKNAISVETKQKHNRKSQIADIC